MNKQTRFDPQLGASSSAGILGSGGDLVFNQKIGDMDFMGSADNNRGKGSRPVDIGPNNLNDYLDNLPNNLQSGYDAQKKGGLQRGATAVPGDRFGSTGFSQKPGTAGQPRNTLKFKQLSTLYPSAKTGNFMNFMGSGDGLETMKEDREAVESLEKWDNEFKMQMFAKSSENEKKNGEGGIQLAERNMFKMPELNQQIVNLANDEDGMTGEKDGRMIMINERNKNKIRIPQKSLETVMNEYNRKILNDILYQRVSRQLKDPNSNKVDLESKTKTISSDTIGNFKNLQMTMQLNPKVIQYDDLYQKLNAERNLPNKIFDFSEEQKIMAAAQNDYANMEQKLKSDYEYIIAEVHGKKEQVNGLRLTVHENMTKMKEIQEELDELRRRYEALDIQLNAAREKGAPQKKQQGNRRVPGKIANSNIAEIDRITKSMDEKLEQERFKKHAFQTLQFETDKSQQRLNNLEREIKDMKFKKNQIRIQLKHLYLKILKSEDQTTESSFISIIKSLWRINEEVIEDMFPNYLDTESKKYLIENARLEYELEQLEFIMKHDEFRDFGDGDPENDELYARFIQTQQSLSAPLSEVLQGVSKRLQTLKKGLVKMKRPVFIKDGATKNRIIRWEELNLEANEMAAVGQERQYIQEKINIAILNIKKKLSELREREIDRIYGLYINKEVDEKNLRTLNKILVSLFGRQHAEKIYMKFVRLKQNHELKVAQNKTFVFSSVKSFTNAPPSSASQNKYTMMLSYASNFRADKKNLASTMYASSEQTKRDSMPALNKRESEQQSFNNEIAKYEENAKSEINYKYNPSYNYAPDLQNADDQSTYYIKKSPADLLSPTDKTLKTSKSSLKSPMSKTAQSFNRVKFKENTDEKPKEMRRAETSQNARLIKNAGIQVEHSPLYHSQ